MTKAKCLCRVQGYLVQVRKRPDMFTEENVSAIFGNVESLYVFQSDFLQQLELCIDWQQPHKSAIGQAFIRNVRNTLNVKSISSQVKFKEMFVMSVTEGCSL